MNGSGSPPRRSACPLNAALEVFGDRWSLLVVRDLMFKGRTSFGELREGGEGIATNVLADRLQRLEREGIVERTADASDARRVVYRLTNKGIDLAPVLVEMIVWGASHEETAAPPAEVEEMKTRRPAVLARIRRQWAKTTGPAGAAPTTRRARRSGR